jgi:hypothetical protein
MRGVRIVASMCLVFLAFGSSAFAREWKDSTGQISRAGDFVDYRDGRVIVRVTGGREMSTALEHFSPADQTYVRDLLKANGKEARVPAKLATQRVEARTANYETGSPPATTLAQTAPPSTAEARTETLPAGDSRTGGTSHDKRVFYAECGTFHIIRGEAGVAPIVGTAHYAFPYWWPNSCCCYCCCPCTGPWYLSFLRETSFSGGWLYAHDIGTSDVTRWAFAYFNDDGCGHPIWYRKMGAGGLGPWRFFGYASWTRPK